MVGDIVQLEGATAHKLTSRLAAQIIERTRQLALPVGTHLKEQELADTFRVSRTPIRMALNALVDLDLVERSPNRGFFLKRPAGLAPGAPSVDAAPDGADEDPLYFQIAEDRLTGQLETKVAEAEIARRYGVTHARLSRLLARMAEEGWLIRLPGHGWEFQPVLTSPEAYDQGYRYRMLIEPAALLEPGYAIDNATFHKTRAQQIAMLEGGIQRWSRSETFTANSVFHEVLVAGSHNPFLLEGLRRVNRLRRLLEYRTHQHRGRLTQECRDHLHLLDLIEARKLRKASLFLHDHLDRARGAKRGIIEQTTRSVAPGAAQELGEVPKPVEIPATANLTAKRAPKTADVVRKPPGLKLPIEDAGGERRKQTAEPAAAPVARSRRRIS